MEEPRSQPPHIALLSDAGTGHLIPVATLANRLFVDHKLPVTLITQPTPLSAISHQSILTALPREISIISLPQIPADLIPNGTTPQKASLLTVANNIPHIRDVLTSLASNNPTVILIVDMFGILAFDVAKEAGIRTYLFFTTNCTVLSLGFHLPKLAAVVDGEFEDMAEPVEMPGCVPIHGRDLPDFGERGSESFDGFLRFLKMYHLPEAILVNSFYELEPGPIGALKGDSSLPPVFPIGPLVRPGSSEQVGCLKWLDGQPKGSVIYVSFGSGGTLAGEQMEELALGLEMSGQRFVWVVKSPNESEASGDYFGLNRCSPVEFMPEGFMQQTEGRGLVVPNWAPQVEILSHEATGGFMTHCGWNSTLESMVNGVPLIAWPLYAEQNMNAVVLSEELGVAVRVRAGGDDGVVRRDEIARLVRGLMEGEEGRGLRRRMGEIKGAAASALEEVGSSYNVLSEIAQHWYKP